MVNTADGYDYVVGADVDAAHPHGDLDRIIIDGEIMPLRTGNTSNVDADGNAIPRANILRGEDIAFLAEWVNQRRFAVTGGYYATTTGSGSSETSIEKEIPGRPSSPVTKFVFSRKRAAPGVPYWQFSYLALEARYTSLFMDYPSKSFAVPPGATKDLIDKYYGGVLFEIDGLACPGHGSKLRKEYVADYFAKAQTFADKGIGLISEVKDVSFATSECQYVVSKWENSHGGSSPYSDFIPKWGFLESDLDTGDYLEVHIYSHRYGYGLPPSGRVILSIDAPHGSRAVAICAFHVSALGVEEDVYNNAVLLQPRQMTKTGTHTFVLYSNDFASTTSVDAIVSASGVTFPPTDKAYPDGWTSHKKRVDIFLDVCPVVFFDDHTKWQA